MTQLEYTRLAQILGNQSAVNQWMAANQELVNGQPSKVALPEITLPRRETEPPASDPNQLAVGQNAQPNPLAVPIVTNFGNRVPEANMFSAKAPTAEGDTYRDQTDDLRNQRLMGPMQQQLQQFQGVSDFWRNAGKSIQDVAQADYDRLYNPKPGTPEYNQMQQDKWWNIAAAFLKPTASSSLGESFGNVAEYLGSEAAAQRANRAALNKQLMELGQAYDVAGLKGQFDLAGDYLRASKPQERKTGFNPVTGELVYLDTGLPVTPPPPEVGEIRRGYRFKGGDPAAESNWEKVR